MVDIGIMIGTTQLNTDKVRSLLDSPSNSFLTDNAIIDVVKRSYNWVNSETTIGDYEDASVIDAIYAFAIWQVYMIYVESVSEYFKLQTPRMIMTRLEEFQSVAILYCKSIGIVWPLDKDGHIKGMNVDEINVSYGYSSAMGVLTLHDVYDSD